MRNHRDRVAAMDCPRCETTELHESSAEPHARSCATCEGSFLPPASVEHLLVDGQGIDMAMLRELAGQYGGPRLKCPSCALMTSPVKLRGAMVDLCLNCGGLWLDAGELKKVSLGKFDDGSTVDPRPA